MSKSGRAPDRITAQRSYNTSDPPCTPSTLPGSDILTPVAGSSLPVIVVTSSDSPSDMEAIRQLGATAYFRKPHDLDEFMLLANVVTDAIRK